LFGSSKAGMEPVFGIRSRHRAYFDESSSDSNESCGFPRNGDKI
jgi:hypothetical protein